jgi:pentatricopeptide repeat protein
MFSGAHLIKNNRHAEAEDVYRELIKRNPENHLYYRQV